MTPSTVSPTEAPAQDPASPGVPGGGIPAEPALERGLAHALRREIPIHPFAAELRRLREENARLGGLLTRVHETREDFLAIVSHELRTPLTSILGFVELLMATTPRNKVEEWQLLEGALESARELNRVIDDMLQMAELESGETVLAAEAFDLADTARGALRRVEDTASAKGLGIRWEEPEIRPPLVWGDVNKTHTVLRHVLENAVKFTRDGHVAVTLLHDGEPDLVHVRVADTGIGFPPEQGERLMHAFRQLERPSVRSHGGAGLGLAIASRLLDIMNGRLLLHSEGVGRGTTVTVSLPAAR